MTLKGKTDGGLGGAKFTFTVTSANATVGATYTNSGVTFTVVATIAASTTLILSSSSNTAPTATGTLTKASGTGDATITYSAYFDYLIYTTPSTTTNAALSLDMTSAISIGSGINIWFVGTSSQTASPTPTITTNPCFTTFLPTQLQTTGSAAAGDTANVTMALQYNEN